MCGSQVASVGSGLHCRAAGPGGGKGSTSELAGERRVKRPIETLGGAISALRNQISAVANQSGHTLLLGTVLVVSAVSGVVGFVLTQYYSVDALSSLVSNPEDCINQ